MADRWTAPHIIELWIQVGRAYLWPGLLEVTVEGSREDSRFSRDPVRLTAWAPMPDNTGRVAEACFTIDVHDLKKQGYLGKVGESEWRLREYLTERAEQQAWSLLSALKTEDVAPGNISTRPNRRAHTALLLKWFTSIRTNSISCGFCGQSLVSRRHRYHSARCALCSAHS